MVIPQRLREILARDSTLEAGVQLALNTFEPWLSSSGMPFFPGFTDHSPTHISEVLTACSSLISDDAYEVITPHDVGVLVLGVLLHDCGMHLTEDGFRNLISGQYDAYAMSELGDKPWSSLWSEFLREASRFDGRKLQSVFGDATPVDLRSFDPNNLSERDRLLVGEFVRRHHAALAHQIARHGVPGPAKDRLGLNLIDVDVADLSGLVARSHNRQIRDTY